MSFQYEQILVADIAMNSKSASSLRYLYPGTFLKSLIYEGPVLGAKTSPIGLTRKPKLCMTTLHLGN